MDTIDESSLVGHVPEREGAMLGERETYHPTVRLALLTPL